jgi:hypothetical protein
MGPGSPWSPRRLCVRRGGRPANFREELRLPDGQRWGVMRWSGEVVEERISASFIELGTVL